MHAISLRAVWCVAFGCVLAAAHFLRGHGACFLRYAAAGAAGAATAVKVKGSPTNFLLFLLPLGDGAVPERPASFECPLLDPSTRVATPPVCSFPWVARTDYSSLVDCCPSPSTDNLLAILQGIPTPLCAKGLLAGSVDSFGRLLSFCFETPDLRSVCQTKHMSVTTQVVWTPLPHHHRPIPLTNCILP